MLVGNYTHKVGVFYTTLDFYSQLKALVGMLSYPDRVSFHSAFGPCTVKPVVSQLVCGVVRYRHVIQLVLQ